MTKNLYRNSNAKKWLQETFSHVQNFLPANSFIFVLLISNHTVFSFNLKLICTCEVFKKLKLSGSCNFSYLKNSLVQINSKLNSKPYDYLYKTLTMNNKDQFNSPTFKVALVVSYAKVAFYLSFFVQSC